MDDDEEVSVTDELAEPCRFSTAPRACSSIGSAEAKAASSASTSSAVAISSDDRLPIVRLWTMVCNVSDADDVCAPLFVREAGRAGHGALDPVLPLSPLYGLKIDFFWSGTFLAFCVSLG